MSHHIPEDITSIMKIISKDDGSRCEFDCGLYVHVHHNIVEY